MRRFIKLVQTAFLTSLIAPVVGYSQSLVNLADGINVVLSDSAQLVVANSSDSALITSGSGAHIISEGEGNRVVWQVGTDTGTYSIPFGTKAVSQGGNGTAIPMTLKVTTAGTGNGELQFSTYETSSDNNTPRPSTVSNTNDNNSNDVSLKMVDRFWAVQSSGYTTNPQGTISFNYDDNSNEAGGSNSITEGFMHPMKWNSGSSFWEGVTSGTHDAASNSISGIPVSGNDLNTFWTMFDNGNPLPVSLTSFHAICENNVVKVEWTTASEINNDYFSICIGSQALHFNHCVEVTGQGTTNLETPYQVEFEASEMVAPLYVQLTQVDFNGVESVYPLSLVEGCGGNQAVHSELTLYPNPFKDQIMMEGSQDGRLEVEVIDALGRVVINELVEDKILNTSALTPGSYMVNVKSPQGEETGGSKYFRMVKTGSQ